MELDLSVTTWSRLKREQLMQQVWTGACRVETGCPPCGQPDGPERQYTCRPTLYRDRLDKLERRSRLSMRSNPSGTCEAEALLATSPAVSVCTPSSSPSLSSAVSHSTTAGMNVADSGHDIVSRAAAVCQAQFLPFPRERIARRI